MDQFKIIPHALNDQYMRLDELGTGFDELLKSDDRF